MIAGDGALVTTEEATKMSVVPAWGNNNRNRMYVYGVVGRGWISFKGYGDGVIED